MSVFDYTSKHNKEALLGEPPRGIRHGDRRAVNRACDKFWEERGIEPRSIAAREHWKQKQVEYFRRGH